MKPILSIYLENGKNDNVHAVNHQFEQLLLSKLGYVNSAEICLSRWEFGEAEYDLLISIHSTDPDETSDELRLLENVYDAFENFPSVLSIDASVSNLKEAIHAKFPNTFDL